MISAATPPWDRLRDKLIAVKPDETVTVQSIASETELERTTVQAVLDGLARAGLFEQQEEEVFVRRSLFDEFAQRITGVKATARPAENAEQIT